MEFKFEKQFRKDNPQTIEENDKHFDLSNYNEWLEKKHEESINIIKESLSHIADLKLGNSAPFPLRSFEDECRELIKEATTI